MSDAETPRDEETPRDAETRLRIRVRAEDFRVDEQPLYAPTGEGGHTFVWIEKRDRTTEQIARALARAAGVAPRDVGYAGRKDRHAVTRQWFSAPDLDPEQALALELEGATVLDARRHPHKLRTGQLAGNRFDVVVRSDDPIDVEAARARAEVLERRGLPNRYGAQRYGREGENRAQARRMIETGEGPRDRRAARFLLSALQAECFDAVLDARIDAYDGVLLGDVARVEASGGLFWVDDPETDALRAERFEISATGPIPGRKMRPPRDDAAAVEAAALAGLGLPPLAEWKRPRGVRAPGARRPLRVRPDGLALEALDEGRALRVRCGLPPGAYVTVLLEALVGPFAEGPLERDVTERRTEADVS